jgi:hypothetical protein
MNGLDLSNCLLRDEPVRDPDARDDLQALGVSRHLEAGRVPAEHCAVRLVHRTAGLLGAHLDHLQDITEAQVGACAFVSARRRASAIGRRRASS